MKKIYFALILLCGTATLTSCYSTYSGTSYREHLEEIDKIAISLNKEGYELSGKASSTQNNIHVTNVSYSTKSGYGTAMANDYVTTDRYTFINSDGNNVCFEVSYNLRQSFDSILYITNVNIPQCSTSNPKEYNKMCGNNSPIYNITNTPQRTYEEINIRATIAASILWISAFIGSILYLFYIE